ncbi:MAG: hypothetical protein HGB12_08465, partial [Bacteroidetes bacterium]|nr:hypothetical protein [Bacteroidota bacterium]
GLAYNSENYSGFAWTMFLGGRYFFNHDYGALLELGYGVTYINIGIAKKFRT